MEGQPSAPSFDFPPGRWRAKWIWADASTKSGEPVDGRHAVALRRVIELADVPTVVPARVSAISRYVLYVNGTEAARGPVRANPRRQPYDVVDLAPFLRQGGANAIGVIANLYGRPTPWWLPPPRFANDLSEGAFVFEASLHGDEWVVTDNTWHATILDGWTATRGADVAGRGRELIDSRSLPADWAAPGAELSWPAAIVRRAMTTGEPGHHRGPPSYPGGPLGSRPLTWPDVVDVELSSSSSDGYVADRIVVGNIAVDAEAPAGSEIVVRVAEFLGPDGKPAPGEHDASVSFTSDGSRRTLESFDLYGLRGAFVDVEGGTVHRMSVRERLHPVRGDAFFECSDERLNKIWAVGRRTVSICSLDSYIDCPTREQRAWTGDSVVHQMVDLTTNTDWTLARWHPRLTAVPRSDGMLPMAVAGDIEHSDFAIIPDWPLHWVHSVWNLYRYCGDADETRSLLGVAEGVLRWFEPFCDDTGLPNDVFGWVIIDWSSVYTEGVSSVLCGLWARSLLEFAEMAEWLGDAGRAQWARSVHARVTSGFERLWDPDRNRYVDSMVAGVRRPMASQHAQAAAIVGGLAPEDRWTRLVYVLTNDEDLVHAAFSVADGPSSPNSEAPVGTTYLGVGHPDPWWDTDRQVVRAQPFFRYVVHDALAAAGRSDLVAGQCLDWTIALERCDTSWTETWYGGTISHGWSSTPTRDLMVRVLGVEPAEPGFEVASIDPALGDLEWAKGAVPSTAGLIRVDVRRDGVDVDSPVPFVHRSRRYEAGSQKLES
ncbi:MAG: alpha-L-rhamnosidase [Actinomycetota bacterium]